MKSSRLISRPCRGASRRIFVFSLSLHLFSLSEKIPKNINCLGRKTVLGYRVMKRYRPSDSCTLYRRSCMCSRSLARKKSHFTPTERYAEYGNKNDRFNKSARKSLRGVVNVSLRRDGCRDKNSTFPFESVSTAGYEAG